MAMLQEQHHHHVNSTPMGRVFSIYSITSMCLPLHPPLLSCIMTRTTPVPLARASLRLHCSLNLPPPSSLHHGGAIGDNGVFIGAVIQSPLLVPCLHLGDEHLFILSLPSSPPLVMQVARLPLLAASTLSSAPCRTLLHPSLSMEHRSHTDTKTLSKHMSDLGNCHISAMASSPLSSTVAPPPIIRSTTSTLPSWPVRDISSDIEDELNTEKAELNTQKNIETISKAETGSKAASESKAKTGSNTEHGLGLDSVELDKQKNTETGIENEMQIDTQVKIGELNRDTGEIDEGTDKEKHDHSDKKSEEEKSTEDLRKYHKALEKNEVVPWVKDEKGKYFISVSAESITEMVPALPLNVGGGTTPQLMQPSGTASYPFEPDSIQYKIASAFNVAKALCERNTKKDIQLSYQKYLAIHDIFAKFPGMIANNIWKERRPSNNDIIEVFMSKSTYYYYYSNLFSMVSQIPALEKWLKGDSDAPRAIEVWGSGVKPSLDNLKKLLDNIKVDHSSSENAESENEEGSHK
ncbi:hypothetical protein BDQ17DRAFT_1434090 [Cyathus striatus]|nr:hypothetical protein BDQ17DRAFT_1434090 [Cyathus striatus]